MARDFQLSLFFLQALTSFIKASDIGFFKPLLPQFEHVKWIGFRAWDLIMPLFLFVVGAAMPFSFAKRLARGDSKKLLYAHILKRVLILFVLGLICQGHLLDFDLSKLVFHLNTLHAIAAGYLISSLIILNLNLTWQIAVTTALLILFWLILTVIPVPGFGSGVLTPEGNIGLYLDRWVLEKIGCLRFCETNLNSMRPLSSITFTCNVMLGVFAGKLLHSNKSEKKKILWLLTIGVSLVILGLFWGHWFPIIKKLWTSSFVLYAAGWSYLLLALFYLVIDVWGLKKWAFGFRVIGTNAITAYVATHLFDFRNFGGIFVDGMTGRVGLWDEFIQFFAAFTILWLLLYWMYRSKSFVKL